MGIKAVPVACLALLLAGANVRAATGVLPAGSPPEHGPQRPPLFLREQWQPTPGTGEHPLAAASLGNPGLDLTLIVPAGQINLAGIAGDENNPLHIWTGLCSSPCGVALRDRTHFADLTGLARLRWSTRTSGFHQLRPLLKLADGTWVVGDRADGSPRDWLVSEIAFADLHWLKVDITRAVTTGVLMDEVDLSKVDEIGFLDLMPGSGHGPGGWSDVALFEIYGKAISRER